MLEFRDEVGTITLAEEVKEKATNLDESAMLKKNVFGDNTTILFGTCNNTQVTNSLIKNDKTALADELRKNGVEEEGIAALDMALAEDPVPTASGQYRSAVQGWMKPMPESAEV